MVSEVKLPRGRSGRPPHGNRNAAKGGVESQMRVRATSPESLAHIKAMTPAQRGAACERWLEEAGARREDGDETARLLIEQDLGLLGLGAI